MERKEKPSFLQRWVNELALMQTEMVLWAMKRKEKMWNKKKENK